MPRPSLINLVRVEGIITQGDCPICRKVFCHTGKVCEESRNQIPDMYSKHLHDEHAAIISRDPSLAAVRIIREATEDR
jgi:hypothetical protein